MKIYFPFLLVLLLLSACSSITPGSDLIVVRVEQTETTGLATVNLITAQDDANRSFWITNAPAFHNFVEQLRVPMTVTGTNGSVTLPRGLAILQQLDNVKLAYKAGTTTSNELQTVLNTSLSILNQASAWQTIVTNSVLPK